MNIEITQLDRSLPSDVVITVHWQASLTEDEITVDSYGSVNLELKDPADPSFVSFENLTEEIVIGWVNDKIGQEILDGLNRKLQEVKHPKVVSGLPWADPIAENTAPSA
jgi:hypothetical protein